MATALTATTGLAKTEDPIAKRVTREEI